MLAALALASVVAWSGWTAPVRCSDAPARPGDDTLRELYASGVDYATFLAAAEARRELWLSNTERGEVPGELLARARAVGGTWYLLAVSIDGCSDSVSTVPFVARLVELVEGLDMRIVDSTAGRSIMEAHPTRDDRAATPTVVLLDASWNEAGCFVERPDPLQTWYQESKASLSSDELFEGKMAWYAEDSGVSTLREIVEILEGAAEGRPICRG